MSDYSPYQWKYYQKNRQKLQNAKNQKNWENKVTCPWCGQGVELPDLIHPRCAEAKKRLNDRQN